MIAVPDGRKQQQANGLIASARAEALTFPPFVEEESFFFWCFKPSRLHGPQH